MEYKTCSACHNTKNVCYFSVRKTSKDGYRNECKDCRNAAQRKRRVDNPEKARLIDNLSYVNNIESKKLQNKLYRENNRAKHRASRSRRKQQKLNATPSWANKFLVDTIFEKARRLELWLGGEFQVDHIVPIMSNYVCGLHCEQNLQILTKAENLSKGNRFWPDMW